MKSLLLVFVLFACLLSGTALAQDTASQEKEALTAAKSWLALCDAGRYQKNWREASVFFRNAISEKDFAKALTGLRGSLGALESRTAQTVTYATSLPAAPDGKYVVMTFATTFANKKTATETVTFMLDTDKRWRVAGYYIR